MSSSVSFTSGFSPPISMFTLFATSLHTGLHTCEGTISHTILPIDMYTHANRSHTDYLHAHIILDPSRSLQ
jgi:hypothetical protein